MLQVRAAMTAEVLRNPGSAMARDLLLNPKDVTNVTSQAAEGSGMSDTEPVSMLRRMYAAMDDMPGAQHMLLICT